MGLDEYFKGLTYTYSPIKGDGSLVTDEAVKADKFNRYFYSVFTQENMSNFDNLAKSLKFAPSLLSTVTFSPQGVLDQLLLVNVSKACGPDLITGFLLKEGAKVIASPLSYLFTTSMRTAALPRDCMGFQCCSRF